MTLHPPNLQLITNHPEITRDALCPDFIQAAFCASPFLHHLAQKHPDWLVFETEAIVQNFETVMRGIAELKTLTHEDAFMLQSRLLKNHAMLLTALADFSGIWDFSHISHALSQLAKSLIEQVLRFALYQMRAQIRYDGDVSSCGFVIIALGKLGAFELNYSSDVDLLLLYRSDIFQANNPERSEQIVLRFAHYLLHLLEKRLPSGYLFRTDLRLRPNPASTPPAITLNTALIYYESIARNWERMVMIRAKPIAGDLVLGQHFLEQISPFVWRRFLDYDALRDIYDSQQHFGKTVPQDFFGYNLKKHTGGIRCCEFTIQLMQLLWGGKYPNLRTARTLESLKLLHEMGLVDDDAAADLRTAYPFLRALEHRLQMQNDLQIQTLPASRQDFENFAHFAGYSNAEGLQQDLQSVTEKTQTHWANLRKFFGQRHADPDLQSSRQARGEIFHAQNLESHATKEHLQHLGFSSPDTICHAITHWQTGNLRAASNARARQLLANIMPDLLANLANTLNPDQAFFAFDRFLSSLPSGIQLFSLFSAHPPLMRIIADIMGNAPELALNLSSHPHLLEVFLENIDNFDHLSQAQDALAQSLSQSHHYEDILSQIREFTQKRQFNISCHLLNGQMTIAQAAQNLTVMAEAVIAKLTDALHENFAQRYGACGEFAVIAMGKFGARLLLPHSDLDLVYLYRSAQNSDGKKSLFPGTYYEKFAQRLITALTVPTASGELYEVDCRLRLWGSDGSAAHSLEQYQAYYQKDARHWEKMALSRARVIYGSDDFRVVIETRIQQILAMAAENPQKHFKNVKAMRAKIAENHPPMGDFDIKYQYGGLLDLEFILQSLYLKALAENIRFTDNDYHTIIRSLAAHDILSASEADILHQGLDFYLTVQALLRLMHITPETLEKTPKNRLGLLASAMGYKNFDECQKKCQYIATEILAIVAKFIHNNER